MAHTEPSDKKTTATLTIDGNQVTVPVGATILEAAAELGINPALMHRVAVIGAGTLDSLPHNGAVITLLAVTGLTHKVAYKDIFAITLIKTSAVFAIIATYYLTGLV